ncbi:MAG: recombination mediator RecR, partial [Spirochaetales bacterium]
MTALDNLSKALSRLPGVGPKSAARIAFYLVRSSDDYNRVLADGIATIKQKVKPCSICGSYTENDPCPICQDAS